MAANTATVNYAIWSGPILLGYLLNWCLFGVLTVQVYWYYIAFPKDRWQAKSLVVLVYLIELVQTLIMMNDCWNTYAVGFGNPDGLAKVRNEWLAATVLTAIVSFMVQLFYAYRLHKFSDGSKFAWLICALAVTQLVGGVITGALFSRVDTWSDVRSMSSHVYEAMWLGGSVACDVIIAACMVYYLAKGASGVQGETKTLANKLIRMVVETGCLTATIAILALILTYAFPVEPFHATPYFMIAKTYSNSALAMFNNRIRIYGGGDSEEQLPSLHIAFTSATSDTEGTKTGADHHTAV